MASKKSAVTVSPLEALNERRIRIEQIDHVLKLAAPSVSVIREQFEKGTGAETLSDIQKLSNALANAKAQYDAQMDEYVKSEVARRQATADTKALNALKAERTTLATEYNSTVSVLKNVLKMDLPEIPELERAPRISLSESSGRGKSVKSFRMVYTVNGEESKYSLSSIGQTLTNGYAGKDSKMGVDQFIGFLSETTGKNPRTESFDTVTLTFPAWGDKTKTLSGKRVDIPSDAPSATE